MDLYGANPYLVLWLPLHASARTIRRRAEDLIAADAPSGTALSPTEAEALLLDPESRLWHSLFWPLIGNADDRVSVFNDVPADARTAFHTLCESLVWSDTDSGDGLSERHNRAIAFHALAIKNEVEWKQSPMDISLLNAAENHWEEAVGEWLSLFADEAFWDDIERRFESFDGSRTSMRIIRSFRRRLPETLVGVHIDLATEYLGMNWIGAANRHVHHMGKLCAGAFDLDDLAQNLFASLSKRTEAIIEDCTAKAENQPRRCGEAADRLLAETEPIREMCLLLLPCSHCLAAGILDDIAKATRNLCIRYGNETGDGAKCLAILETALAWAQDPALREKLASDQAIIQEWPKTATSSVNTAEQSASPPSHTPPKVDSIHRREFTGRRVEPPPQSHTPPKVDDLHRREFTGRHVETPPPPGSPPHSNTPPGVDTKYRKESFRRNTENDSSTKQDEREAFTSRQDVEEVEAIPVDSPWPPNKRPLKDRVFDFLREYRWRILVVFGIIALIVTILHVSNERQRKEELEARQRAETDRLRAEEASRRAVAEKALWQSRRQPLPATGNVQLFTTAEADSPFQITAPFGSNYYLKLVSRSGKKDIATIFVRAGTTTEVFVPSGTYEVRYAWGSEWYGPYYLFGPGTGCAKADQSFTFTPGNGYTLVLRKVENGNLRTVPMQWEDF